MKPDRFLSPFREPSSMSEDPPPVSLRLSKTSTIIPSICGRLNSHIRIHDSNRKGDASSIVSLSSTPISSSSQPASSPHASPSPPMDYIHPNLYLETFKRLPSLQIDIGELSLEILDIFKKTADPAIGLAGGYDATTGDLCALAISTQKRILILSFQDTDATEAGSMLADSILLNPSLKKYAFGAPRLITALPVILPSLRSKEVYDVIPKGRHKPHTTSAITSVLGSSHVNEENVIEVFSSEICDFEDLKHIFNIAMRAWAACYVSNKSKSSSNLKILLPFDTTSLTDDVCHPVLYMTTCCLL